MMHTTTTTTIITTITTTTTTATTTTITMPCSSPWLLALFDGLENEPNNFLRPRPGRSFSETFFCQKLIPGRIKVLLDVAQVLLVYSFVFLLGSCFGCFCFAYVFHLQYKFYLHWFLVLFVLVLAPCLGVSAASQTNPTISYGLALAVPPAL